MRAQLNEGEVMRRVSDGYQASILAASFLFLFLITPGVAIGDDEAISEGRALYSEHCASCHGADLQGQPNWQSRKPDGTLPAPPHDDTGHTWHHGDRLLFDYVKQGGQAALAARGVKGFTSAMPEFGTILNDAQIHNILDYIKSNWSAKAQAY